MQVPNQGPNSSKNREMIVRIEVRGWYGPRSSPEGVIRDMLRYDDGTIESTEEEPGRPRYFIAIVNCKRFTKERWGSFGLSTKKL